MDIQFHTAHDAQGHEFTMQADVRPHLDQAQIVNRQFAQSAIRKVPDGQRIWSEGDGRSHIYLLRSGAIRFSRMLPDGRRVVMGFAYPGDLIGLGAEFHTSDADAIQCCRLEAMSIAAFQRAVHADAAFARLVQGEVSLALSSAQNHLVVVTRLNAAERLAHFLVALSAHNRRRGNSPTSVVLPMRRVDIADFLGLTIETVSRTLTAFRKAQLISMDQPSVLFLKGLGALARLASGNSDAGDSPVMKRAA